ncbi:hypothetical protein CDV52_19645 [Haematobacter missouriensis]|nr:hypothetical protein CDV52_19645 [Haematobacter missouriensis]
MCPDGSALRVSMPRWRGRCPPIARYSSMQEMPMFDDADMARIAALQQISPVRRLRQIAEAISAETDLPVEDILGTSRVRVVAQARHLMMYIAHREGFSFSAIGRALGLDHSSTMHGVNSERLRRMEEPEAKPVRLIRAAGCR